MQLIKAKGISLLYHRHGNTRIKLLRAFPAVSVLSSPRHLENHVESVFFLCVCVCSCIHKSWAENTVHLCACLYKVVHVHTYIYIPVHVGGGTL